MTRNDLLPIETGAGGWAVAERSTSAFYHTHKKPDCNQLVVIKQLN